MADARLIVVVKDKGDAGREVYRGVLEALRVQALRAAGTLQARVSGHAQTLIAAFPGPTVSNIECAACAADVHQRWMPEVTQQLERPKVQRWVQASMMAREYDEMCGRETATSSEPACTVETASDEAAAPQTTSRGSPPEADRMVSSRATLGGEVNGPTLPRER